MEENIKRVRGSLDILTIIATVAFIMIGISDTILLSKNIVSNDFWWAINIGEALFRIALPLVFMVIGAILFNIKDEPFFDFYKNRLFKLILSYLIWSVVLILLDLKTNNMDITIKAVYESILNFDAYYHLWIFKPLLIVYFAMPIVRRLFYDVDNNFYIYVLTGWFILLSGSLLIEKFIETSFISTGMINTSYFAYCLLGAAIINVFENKYKLKSFSLLLFIVGIGITAYFINSTYNVELSKVDMYYYSPFSINIILTTIGLFTLLTSFEIKESKYIRFFSKLTLGVIIIHPVILLIYKTKLPFEMTIGYFMGISITTIVFSYLISFILSKIPYVNKIV